MRDSEKLRQEMLGEDDQQLEKKDMPALWLSGLLTIGLPCLLLILIIVGVTILLFGGVIRFG
ncbi:MAG: hypothetical protein IJJ42_09595 [Clostridia bacterium]|nr:hypothetical protein [Clostridia bacterium]